MGFSVLIYTVCALVCIGMLLARRWIGVFGGELGGNNMLKYVSGAIMIFLWVFYVLISSLQAYGHISVNF